MNNTYECNKCFKQKPLTSYRLYNTGARFKTCNDCKGVESDYDENGYKLSIRRDSSSSKYEGVSYHKTKKKWQVSIHINNKKISLGTFAKELDAAKVYNEYLNEHMKTLEPIEENNPLTISRNTTCTCSCGSVFKKRNLNVHLKSNKHMIFEIANRRTDEPLDDDIILVEDDYLFLAGVDSDSEDSTVYGSIDECQICSDTETFISTPTEEVFPNTVDITDCESINSSDVEYVSEL